MSTYFGVNLEFVLTLFLAARREEDDVATYNEPRLVIILLLHTALHFLRKKEIIYLYITILKRYPGLRQREGEGES